MQEHEICQICYSAFNNSKAVFLECFHSLCERCFSRLVNSSCPFCRFEITKKFKREIRDVIKARKVNNFKLIDSSQSIPISFKQRTLTNHQFFVFENNEVYLVYDRQKQKTKKSKNNFRKGSWAVNNYKMRS